MAETPNTPPVASAPAQGMGPVAGPTGRSIFVGMALGALVVAVALGVILSHGGGTSSGYGPEGWTEFHDPGGYFTIALPPGWTIDGGQSGTGTLGGPSGSYTETDYAWVARDPTNGAAGPVVAITYHPLPNAIARQFECQNGSGPNTTVDGLPAQSIGGGWLLSTQAAHYQLNYGFPPDNTAHSTAPTPIPAATATAGQSLTARIAATFKPTPATPLAC
jgi:hypothetical protein